MSIIVSSPADQELLGSIIRLYQAVLGRQPDLPGLDYWYNEAKSKGLGLGGIADAFVTPEILTYSAPRFLTDLYHNVLGREPDDAGYAYWLTEIFANGGSQHYGDVAASFAESAEFKALVADGVAAVSAVVLAGAAPNPQATLPGTPVYEPPVETVIEFVYIGVPTAEDHIILFEAHGEIDDLGQKLDGTALFGTGNPATDWQLINDLTDHSQFGFNLIYRQSAVEIQPTSVVVNGAHVIVNYTAEAGVQDGDFGAPVNLNRSAININWSILAGPGGIGQDGTFQYQLLLEGADGVVRDFYLDFDPGTGQHIWEDASGNPIVVDSPNNAYAEQNSQNFAFAMLGGVADVQPGEYTFVLQKVSLVGLSAGDVVSSLTANVTLVPDMTV